MRRRIHIGTDYTILSIRRIPLASFHVLRDPVGLVIEVAASCCYSMLFQAVSVVFTKVLEFHTNVARARL